MKIKTNKILQKIYKEEEKIKNKWRTLSPEDRHYMENMKLFNL